MDVRDKHIAAIRMMLDEQTKDMMAYLQSNNVSPTMGGPIAIAEITGMLRQWLVLVFGTGPHFDVAVNKVCAHLMQPITLGEEHITAYIQEELKRGPQK